MNKKLEEWQKNFDKVVKAWKINPASIEVAPMNTISINMGKHSIAVVPLIDADDIKGIDKMPNVYVAYNPNALSKEMEKEND